MKTKNRFFPFYIIILLFVFGNCKGPINQMDDIEQISGKANFEKNNSGKYVVLTDLEIFGIYYMREEEKLARDVYIDFSKLYPDNKIFLNISESEDNHMNAVLGLIDYYNLEDPASQDTGIFNNTELQTLYDELILEGSFDLTAALKVGLNIEIKDTTDIIKYMNETEVKNIDQVYSHLLKGSENHLKSFLKVLEKK